MEVADSNLYRLCHKFKKECNRKQISLSSLEKIHPIYVLKNKSEVLNEHEAGLLNKSIAKTLSFDEMLTEYEIIKAALDLISSLAIK